MSILKNSSPEDTLLAALSSKQQQVSLQRCIGSLEGIIKNVIKKDPRVLGILGGYQATYMKNGMVQIFYDYEVTITYRDGSPDSLDDIIVDSGSWDPVSLLTPGSPKDAIVITDDSEAVYGKMGNVMSKLLSSYEGIRGFSQSTVQFNELSPKAACVISYSYLLDIPRLRQYQSRAMMAGRNIWKKILGRSRVPDFVKPYLAYSYLTQECCYDQRAYDEVEGDPGRLPSDPIPHLAYGPLSEGRGICGGLALAFKCLMDLANIECICVAGYLKESNTVMHMWDLVKLDGLYYHVDPTWGIKDEGVFVSGLLQTDVMMKATHTWKETDYPAAKGTRFDYDYIEEYLADHGDDMIADGAEEKYIFPEQIID